MIMGDDINILDCENKDSILTSLESIFNTERNKILTVLRNLDINEVYKRSNQEKFGYEHLYDEFLKYFQLDTKKIKAFWFHNTRVFEGCKFEEGILPLKLVLPRIERLVDDVVVKLGLDLNKCNATDSYQISHKYNSNVNNGPWGFLIRDFALEVPSGINDYLKLPEMVDDIVRFKYSTWYDAIINQYMKNTIPCIVKFKTDREFNHDKLVYIINYLYNKTNGINLCHNSNTNYSNGGNTITKDDIIRIEYLNKTAVVIKNRILEN